MEVESNPEEYWQADGNSIDLNWTKRVDGGLKCIDFTLYQNYISAILNVLNERYNKYSKIVVYPPRLTWSSEKQYRDDSYCCRNPYVPLLQILR